MKTDTEEYIVTTISSQRITQALNLIHAVEEDLAEYAEKKGLGLAASVYRRDEYGYSITLRHAMFSRIGSRRIFWNHNRTRRDAESAFAGSIDRAKEIIDEAAAAYAERNAKKK